MKHGGLGVAERWVRLDHSILRSPQFRSLTPNARALLVELAMMENGKNNGTFFLSTRDAAARMGVVDAHTARNAFEELEKAGFIACTLRGTVAVKAGDRRASFWRLTWQSFAELKSGPTRDWVNREVTDKRAKRRMAAGCAALKSYQEAETKEGLKSGKRVSPVRDFLTLNSASVRKNPVEKTPKTDRSAANVRNNHTLKSKIGANPPKISDGIFHTYTAGQLEAAPEGKAPTPIHPPFARGSIEALCCEQCGGPRTAGRQGKPKRFCSEACRRKAERQRYLDRRSAA